MKAPDTIRRLRAHFSDIPASEREVLLVARIVLNHLADACDFAQLADGKRLRDGLDFTAWLRELEACVALELEPVRLRDAVREQGQVQIPPRPAYNLDFCPDCGHVHVDDHECSFPIGGGRVCRCERQVTA